MDTNVLHRKLQSIADELYAGSDVTAKKLLAQLLSDVGKEQADLARGYHYEEWQRDNGIIDSGKVREFLAQDITGEPIVLTIERVHQYNINGCVFHLEGGDTIFDDDLYEEFMDFCGDQFSWSNGQNVPDSYFIIALVGTHPAQDVLDAFVAGKIVIKDLGEDDTKAIFGNWSIYITNNTPMALEDAGCIQEDTSSDT